MKSVLVAVLLLTLAALPTLSLAAEPAFVITESAPGDVPFIAVVYDDGSVYEKQLPRAFEGEPRRPPESCWWNGVSLRYVTPYDFEALRDRRPDLAVRPRAVVAQLEHARQSAWDYRIKTNISELTDVGAVCYYASVSVREHGYTDLRLLRYSDSGLTVSPQERSLVDIATWLNEIVHSLLSKKRPRSAQ